MSGLTKKQNNTTFLTISDGNIILRVAQPTETSVPREIKRGERAGEIVHEEHFDSLEGMITNIEKKANKVAWQNEPYVTLALTVVTENQQVYQISTPYGSPYAKGFFTRIEAVDLSQPVEICTWWVRGDDDKFRGFLSLKQNDEKIIPLYSKESGNLPAVEWVKVGSQSVRNDEKLLAFYDGILNKLSASQVQNTPTEQPAEYSGELDVNDQELQGDVKF